MKITLRSSNANKLFNKELSKSKMIKSKKFSKMRLIFTLKEKLSLYYTLFKNKKNSLKSLPLISTKKLFKIFSTNLEKTKLINLIKSLLKSKKPFFLWPKYTYLKNTKFSLWEIKKILNLFYLT